MQRIRVHFSKGGPMRFTGHLDLMRAWARLLRRADLPVAYTQGYNPQARLNLAAALPLGFTSACEVIDIWLKQPLPPEDFLARAAAAVPPGLTVHAAREADLKAKSLQSRLLAAAYLVTLTPSSDVASRVETLLAASSLPRERRGKEYDLRPLIEDVWLEDEGMGMRLAARPGATGRPDEVLFALGLDALSYRIHRTHLFFQDGEVVGPPGSHP
jgi:radical SAM-linked protein